MEWREPQGVAGRRVTCGEKRRYSYPARRRVRASSRALALGGHACFTNLSPPEARETAGNAQRSKGEKKVLGWGRGEPFEPENRQQRGTVPPKRPMTQRVEKASRTVSEAGGIRVPGRRRIAAARPAGRGGPSPDFTIKTTRPQNTDIPPPRRHKAASLGGQGACRPVVTSDTVPSPAFASTATWTRAWFLPRLLHPR